MFPNLKFHDVLPPQKRFLQCTIPDFIYIYNVIFGARVIARNRRLLETEELGSDQNSILDPILWFGMSGMPTADTPVDLSTKIIETRKQKDGFI